MDGELRTVLEHKAKAKIAAGEVKLSSDERHHLCLYLARRSLPSEKVDDILISICVGLMDKE